MGFKCPICQKDFGRNKDLWVDHCKNCCNGVAEDVVSFVIDAAEAVCDTKEEEE